MTTNEKLNEVVAFLKELLSSASVQTFGDNYGTLMSWLDDIADEPVNDSPDPVPKDSEEVRRRLACPECGFRAVEAHAFHKYVPEYDPLSQRIAYRAKFKCTHCGFTTAATRDTEWDAWEAACRLFAEGCGDSL